jgi:hypothetical protein
MTARLSEPMCPALAAGFLSSQEIRVLATGCSVRFHHHVVGGTVSPDSKIRGDAGNRSST